MHKDEDTHIIPKTIPAGRYVRVVLAGVIIWSYVHELHEINHDPHLPHLEHSMPDYQTSYTFASGTNVNSLPTGLFTNQKG